MAAIWKSGAATLVEVLRPTGSTPPDVFRRQHPAGLGIAQLLRTQRGKGSSLEITPIGDTSQILIADLPLERRGAGYRSKPGHSRSIASVIFGAHPNA